PKRRGRSQKPRPIVPAGPLPNQQPAISSQVQPQSSTTNDTPVFVQYVIPTSNNSGIVDASSHLTPAPKSSHATRPRKNSSVGGGNVPSAPKRPRKQKDNSNVSANGIHVTGEENKNNKQFSESLQLPPAVINNSEGSLSSSFTSMSTSLGTSTIPNRKREREHPAPSSPRDTSEIKRSKKEENVDDDVMMEDASVTRDDNIRNSSDEAKSSPSHMEAVFILQSLKEGEGSKSPPTEVVASPSATPDIVGVKEEVKEVTKQVSEEPKVDQFENLVATKVRELSLDESDQFKGAEDVNVKSPLILSEDLAKNSRNGGAVKQTLTPNKPKKKGFNGGNNSRNDATNNKVTRTRQMPSVSIGDQNAGNDSDNDLAMDDGSDDEEYAKRNQPISNHSVDDSLQWNSDEMETEEEVEEEVVIFENTGVKDESKPTFVSSPPPLPSLPPTTASHPNLVRTKNEDCNGALSTISSATHITSANPKNSRPASPITSNCGTASSLVSRKGSVSSEKDVFSDVLDTSLASPSPSTTTSNHITNGNGKPPRPCPPRRRSTMRDDEKLELGAIEWEKNIEIPQHIWEETLRVFEIVKHSKEMKNRQPHRKRNHILASILFILCRQNGLPRTFVEICNAASIRKQEIGSYYRLMLKVFESNGLGGGSNGTVDSAEYLKRWCQNLKLPSHILDAAIHVYKQASELNITTGKCPVSVGAASIWLSISSWNEIRSSWNSNDDHEQIKCEHKDVAQAAGVVNATLVGCFKNLSKYKDQLLPAEFLQEAKTRPPYNHKTSDFSEGSPGSNTVENDCRDEKKTTFFSSTPSLENLKFYGPPLDEDEEVAENDKTKVETIKVESIKVEPTTPTISALPNKVDSITSPRSKSLQLQSKNCKIENCFSNSVKVEPTHSSFKEIKPEKSLVMSKDTVPEPHDDADDELEEGELREDCNDAMMD
ncbi:8403_t:CDS:2, partial [Acaulospora morrowiae]